MDLILQLFPGIGTMVASDLTVTLTRIFLMCFGFLLAVLGFERKLEPLIMIPMGIGMICVNAAVMFLGDGSMGTLFLNPLNFKVSHLSST